LYRNEINVNAIHMESNGSNTKFKNEIQNVVLVVTTALHHCSLNSFISPAYLVKFHLYIYRMFQRSFTILKAYINLFR
jgi:hypothetical protein